MNIDLKKMHLQSIPIIKRFFKKTLSFLHLQLFITFISVPFLLAAGLPLSGACMVGNFIFAPFLTLFLVLSSCIFVCELLSVSSILFIIPLEYLTEIWTCVLAYGNRSWLLALPNPPSWTYVLFALSGGIVLHSKKLRSSLKSSIALCGLMSGKSFLITFNYSFTGTGRNYTLL
ncbi:hypothetical protein H0X06_00800 [Candidatus Dependentiae bacterium]|nr:hypothetical protein [Candidatus Dependentiae bacterium]